MQPLVLIVEDDYDICKMLTYALKPFDCTVITAANGTDAYDRLNETPPDLVIIDLSLPGMSGEELIRYMRAQPSLRAAHIVVVTVYDRELTAPLIPLVDHIIQKPYDLHPFRDIVSEYLPRRVPQ